MGPANQVADRIEVVLWELGLYSCDDHGPKVATLGRRGQYGERVWERGYGRVTGRVLPDARVLAI